MKNSVNIRKWLDIQRSSSCAVSLGNFDGVHCGHRQLLDELISLSRKLDVEPVVVTFYPHPKSLIDKRGGSFLINTPWEKEEIIRRIYPFKTYFVDFSPEFAALSPLDFMKKFLLEKLRAEGFVLGPDYRFGSGARGDISLIGSYMENLEKTVSVVPAVQTNGQTISSTIIRDLLHLGKISEANNLLGYSFFYSGTVVYGDKRGRKLGFPTANLTTGFDNKLLVKEGVYGGRAVFNNKKFETVINIGKNPTFETQKTQIEAHILDFNEYIYGQNLTLELNSYLREEMKFNSREELVLQIKQDIKNFKLKKEH